MDQDQTTAAGFRSEDIQILRRLPAILLREGYIDSYCVLGMLHLRFGEMREYLSSLPDNLRALLALFFLGDPVDQIRLQAVLAADEIGALRRLGILLDRGDSYHTAGLVLLPLFGQFLFIPKPNAEPEAYFGDDSAALAVRVSPPRHARCLDVCAGPGTQSLRCTALAKSVLALEINPIAVSCAELNFVLNSVEDRAQVRQGDLYAALLPGEQFDYVVANPPLLPFPPDLPFPEIADGGDDGMLLMRRVLQGLPDVLLPGGMAQIISSSLGGESGPHAEAEFAEYAQQQGCQIMMTVPARARLRPGDRLFEVLAHSCAAPHALPIEQVRRRMQQHFAARGAEYLYLSFLTITLAGPRPGLQMTQQFKHEGGFWFR